MQLLSYSADTTFFQRKSLPAGNPLSPFYDLQLVVQLRSILCRAVVFGCHFTSKEHEKQFDGTACVEAALRHRAASIAVQTVCCAKLQSGHLGSLELMRMLLHALLAFQKLHLRVLDLCLQFSYRVLHSLTPC